MTNDIILEEEVAMASSGAGSTSKTDAHNGANSDSSSDSGWYDEIELVVQGKEIIVSERLLVQNSRYFAFVFGDIDPDADTVVLKHGQLEDEHDVSDEKKAEPLTLISYATMRSIVDFLETGNLKISDQNAKQLLQAADMLAIGTLETEIFEFLKSGLTVGNCVRRFLLADAKSSWHRLSRHIQRFIQLRFDQLTKHTQIYQLTSADQFARILSDETLSVPREDRALDAALEWIEYDRDTREWDTATVLREVQWKLIRNVAKLREALLNPIVNQDPESLELVTEAITYQELSYEAKLEHWRGKKKPSRWPKMLTCLSYADKPVECFDFEESRWRLLTNKPTATFGAELCYLAGRLYSIGGVQTKQVDRYDVEADCWTGEDGGEKFPELTQFRVAHGAAVVGRRIFVMGGSAKASEDFGPGLNEMEVVTMEERSDITADESEGGIEAPWKMVAAMKVGRSYLASAVVQDRFIHVVGGCLSDGCSTAEVYDVETNSWSGMASTGIKRDSLGLVTFDDELYAFGGYNDIYKDYVHTAEKYDPDKDLWTDLKPMSIARRSPGVVAYRSKIYVVGGMGEHDDLRSAEVYDPIMGTWAKFPYPMKEICGWVSCCMVEKPLRLMSAYDDHEGENGDKAATAAVTTDSSSNSRQQKRPRKLSLVSNNLNGSGSSTSSSNGLSASKQRKASAPATTPPVSSSSISSLGRLGGFR